MPNKEAFYTYFPFCLLYLHKARNFHIM